MMGSDVLSSPTPERGAEGRVSDERMVDDLLEARRLSRMKGDDTFFTYLT